MERNLGKDLLYEQYLDYNYLREQYRNGQLPGLDAYERDLLEFCHGRDMREYLRENVWEKPIVLNSDGGVNWNKTKFRRDEPQPKQMISDDDYYPKQYQPQYQQPMMPQAPQMPMQPTVNEQRFYYLYDDEGNLVAALPKK